MDESHARRVAPALLSALQGLLKWASVNEFNVQHLSKDAQVAWGDALKAVAKAEGRP